MVAQTKVTTIPATLTGFTATPINQRKKRLVAGYARVSTDHDDQFTATLRRLIITPITSKAVTIGSSLMLYTTAIGTKRREGFKRMVADALDGIF